MKTPQFWQSNGVIPTILSPIASIYYAIHCSRIAKIEPVAVSKRVICVGNATVGGAGKTPTVIALAKILQEQGISPHVISRGYGGAITTPTQVNPDEHLAADVGDEPLLIARHAPCWVARRRQLAAEMAIIRGSADAIIMDDGLQNPTLHKDFTLMVVDGGFGFGNGKMLPAGPLREPLGVALVKSDAVLIIGEDTTGVTAALNSENCELPILRATIQPDESALATLKDKLVIAFAGIARPAKFYDTLKQAGATIISTHDFADHHQFTASELSKLQSEVTTKNATLITTEKDHVRLPDSIKSEVLTLPISLRFDDKSMKIISASINGLFTTN